MTYAKPIAQGSATLLPRDSESTGAHRATPASLALDTQPSLDRYDWPTIDATLTEHGAAVLPSLLDGDSCKRIAALYDEERHFRSRVHMARHGFGKGEYRYFAYPLPTWLATLRSQLYRQLVPTANRWATLLRDEHRFPATHEDYLAQCHAAGQRRPTPLLLRYVAGDYNCLHQDLYGEHWFPLQVIVLLDEPHEDFTGGELLLVEQRPRAQSRGSVLPLTRGDAAIIAVNHRPRLGARGYSRVTLRHGVSTVHSGRRHTLGIVLHDAT